MADVPSLAVWPGTAALVDCSGGAEPDALEDPDALEEPEGVTVGFVELDEPVVMGVSPAGIDIKPVSEAGDSVNPVVS
jgi:hypothetical protein